MEAFIETHEEQLKYLNIPPVFYESVYAQFQQGCNNQLATTPPPSEFGSILVIPQLFSWDMTNSRGLLDGLETLSHEVLANVYQSLCNVDPTTTLNSKRPQDTFTTVNCESMNQPALLDAVYSHSFLWTCIVLYRSAENGHVRAALLTPPYYPPLLVTCANDNTEASLSGPFPFRYHDLEKEDRTIVDYSLFYREPINDNVASPPTLDYVPLYTTKGEQIRSIRYAALLKAPNFAMEAVKELYANFLHDMHLVRQQKQQGTTDTTTQPPPPPLQLPNKAIYNVYTDTNDPMQLGHDEAGLSKDSFHMVDNIQDADIIFSFQFLFAPGPLRDYIHNNNNKDILLNQFPYEGAMVQKDHLSREILRQHGIPQPPWAIESYDLETHLGEFVGAAVLEYESTNTWPLWIVKPASGTQSKGHVVTNSLAHILRLVDCGIPRVAQRYIQHPVCFQNRKVDCRCIVILTPNSLYMHQRVYFRIAGKQHDIQQSSDWVDPEKVLTAMHLVDNPEKKHSQRVLLPVDYVTIAQLEQDYDGFKWHDVILPKIHTLVIELFGGMKRAYPAMAASCHSRAVYGVDIMFNVDDDGDIEPKLTEVTFCPANNAICEAYQRDNDLYQNYNTDIFKCMFLGQVAESIVKLE